MTSAVSPPAERERRSLRLPILGIMVAIAITSTMDAIGLTEFSALPLFPLMLLFWRIQRLSAWSLGFTWGRWRDYELALLYPVLVIGSVTLIAWVARALQPESANWGKVCANVALVAVSTILVAIITEEGFFRGWLWGSLARAGKDQGSILIGTSIAFALWHISAVTFKTGFGYELPPAQVPLFVLNAALMPVRRHRSHSPVHRNRNLSLTMLRPSKQSPVSVDNAYAGTLIHAALNRGSLSPHRVRSRHHAACSSSRSSCAGMRIRSGACVRRRCPRVCKSVIRLS
jgi:membrane protease YdiL (CAAX protease family)